MKFLKITLLGGLLIALPALAQQVPDIGFESVGRSRPLGTSVAGHPVVGPEAAFGGFGRGRGGGGAVGGGAPAGGAPAGARGGSPGLNGFRPEDLPDDIEPLPV